MKIKKNAFLVKTFLLSTICAVGFFACNLSPKKNSLKKTEPVSLNQELTLDCQLYTDSGEIQKEYTLFEAWEQLDKYCTTWGKYLVDQSDVVPGNAEGMNAYRDVFVSSCKGDTLLDILNSPSGLKIPKQMDPNILVSEEIFPYRAYGIRFEVPERTAVRVALGNMAIKAYYDVLLKIVEFGKNAEWRNHLLELKQFSVELQDGSEWVSTGEDLLEKMFASAPTLVEKIADIKMQNAEELIAEGVAQKDEWGSLEYGRAPALKEIWGGYAGCSESEMQDSTFGMCMEKCNLGCTPMYDHSGGPSFCVCRNANSQFYHEDAKKACAERGGRLPSKSELVDLVKWCDENVRTEYCTFLKGAESFWTATREETSADTGKSGVYVIYPALEAQTRFVATQTNEKHQVRCVRYPSLELKDPLQPRILASVPRLTKKIQSAVDVIVNNSIDIPSIIEQENWDQLYDLVLERANNKRLELGLEKYDDLDELLSRNGTDEKGLRDAAVYSYAHLVLFPREISDPPSSVEFNTFYDPSWLFGAEYDFEGWDNPQMSLPTPYYVEKLNRGVKKENTDIADISEDSNMETVGLVEMLRDVRQILTNSEWAESETVPAELDEKCKKSLQEATSQIDSFNGKTRIEYEFTYEFDGNVYILSLGLVNPSFKDNADGRPANQVAIYPLGDSKSLNPSPVYEYGNYVDFHQRQREGLKYYKISSFQPEADCEILSNDKKCMPDTVSECELVKAGDGESVESNCTLLQEGGDSHFVELDQGRHRWMIETRVGDGGVWRPVGMINTQDSYDEGRAGAFPLEGRAVGAAEKIVSRRSDDLSDPKCVPINGLDGECFDRDWVPAIDNELIDVSGNGYEESYRHYLALARTAAEKARQMREQLMSDIIELKGAEGSEEALSKKAIENYMAEIEQICGEDTKYDVKTELETVGIDVEKSDFLSRFEKTEYGCNSSTGKPKTDAIHCSDMRNCDDDNPYVLSDFGVDKSDWFQLKPKRKNANLSVETSNGGDWKLGVGSGMFSDAVGLKPGYFNVCDAFGGVYALEDVLDPSRIVEQIKFDSGDYREEISGAIVKLQCWINEYRNYMAAYWSKYPLYGFVEDVKAQSVMDDEPGADFGGCWGQYCQTKSDLIMQLDNLSLAIGSYFSALEKLESKIKEMLLMIRQARTKGEAEKLLGISSVLVQEATMRTSHSQAWRECIKNKKENQDEELSYDSVKTALHKLRYTMHANPSTYHEKPELAAASFEPDCRAAAQRSGVPLLQKHGWIICEMLADAYGGTFIHKGGDVYAYSYWWSRDLSDDQEFCPVGYCGAFTEQAKESDKKLWNVTEYDYGWQSVSLTEKEKIDQVANKYLVMSCYDDGEYEGRLKPSEAFMASLHYFDRYCDSGMWFSFTAKAVDEDGYYKKIRDELVEREYEECPNSTACLENGSTEYDYKTCPEMKTVVDEQRWQKDIYPELLDEALKDNLAANAESMKVQLIALRQDLENAKNEIRKGIRSLLRYNSSLVALEESQVNLWDKLKADIAVAKSSSAVNTSEWRDRFDYRREQYRELLRRARVAAWVARRAIEFRFGIDLEDETQKSIYGDVPALWANDIFKTNTTSCGGIESNDENDSDSEDDSSDKQNTVAKCLTPENRIEEYVQKLEDYVASYGNTPGQNWWFHEDDDTAVISLRDHVAQRFEICDTTLSNLLYFTEELDMDLERIDEVYGEEDIAEKMYMSGWNKNVSMAVRADDASFGIPRVVYLAHRTNEQGLFGDQEKDETVDRLSVRDRELMAEGKPASLSQTISNQEATTKGTVGDLEFSAYLRSAPLHSPNDCDVSSGEQYFPAIGKCGVPCHITEDDPAPWGTCPGGDTPGTRQVCMKAGERVNKNGEYEEAFMCDWCIADKGCIHQNGQVIAMQIKSFLDGERYAQRNVVAYPYWRNESQAVNTVEDEQSVLIKSNAEAYDGVSVAFVSTITENLIPHSEDFGRDWVTTNLSENGRVLGPDGTYGATEFRASKGEQTLSLGLDVQTQQEKIYGAGTNDEHVSGYTGSIWSRTDESPKRTALLTIDLRDVGGRHHVTKRVVMLGKEWKRFEIFGTAEGNDIEHVSFSISSLEGDDWQDGTDLEVWAAQLEEGRGATIYIPTGKNLIGYTGFSPSYWSTAGVEREYDSEVVNPMGRKGSTRIVDNDESSIGEVTRSLDVDAEVLGKQVTFSLFMKSADGLERSSVIEIRQNDINGTGLGSEPLEVSVGPRWQRFELTSTVSQNTAKILLNIQTTRNPGKGTVYLWGEQLEVGGHATGWQRTFPTYGNQARWGQDLFYPFDLGVVGAQLEEYGSYRCDEYGRQVGDRSLCIENYENDVKGCCITNKGLGEEWIDRCEAAGDTALTNPESECTAPEYTCHPVCRCLEGYTDNYRKCGMSSSRSYVRNTYLRNHFDPTCALTKIGMTPYPGIDDLEAYKANTGAGNSNRFTEIFTKVEGPQGQSYYKYTFPVSREAVQSGDFGQFGVISPDNFNYRIRTVAMNVVGTDVVDCSKAVSPRTCANQPWLAYDLKQLGEVYIRNHHKKVSLHPFSIPTGRIKGGKAWASEQEIGFPVSGAHQSALQQVQKVSLMGRPLQGTFELRIYETPELVWENIEDIQMILGYHYWTRSE